MRGCFTFLAAAILAGSVEAACTVPSYNEFYTLPSGYSSADGFVGRFDYPVSTAEPPPSFLQIDYHDDWKAYLHGALDYAFEGNLEVDFNVAENTRRDWYHGIWMHPGRNGREFLRGLTQERSSRRHQYADGVTDAFPTWAIGFYNSHGATAYRRVFDEPCQPDISQVTFPVGTVAFKLLFTGAPSSLVTYLDGSPEWQAHIGAGANANDRSIQTMRLLQVDIAVRDGRDEETGWVFGTFVYDRSVESENPWRRLRPVGLAWGNDPSINPETTPGAVPGANLNESFTDSALAGQLFGWPGRPELGWGGRANGPADNMLSSCLSCHGTAQFPRSDDYGNFPTSAPTDVDERRLAYFRNIGTGEIFDAEAALFPSPVVIPALSLDYSLQLQHGIERMCSAASRGDSPFDSVAVPDVCVPSSRTATPMSAAPPDLNARRREMEAIDWDLLADGPVR